MAEEETSQEHAAEDAENLTSEEQQETPADPDAETPAEETVPAAESTPEKSAEEKKAWDKDRQKKDQEAAEEKRRIDAERIERMESQLAKLIEISAANATAARSPAQQEQVKDEVAEIEKLNAESEALATKAESLIDSDPIESSRASAKAAKLAAQANKRTLDLTKAMGQKLVQRDTQDALSAAERQQWGQFLKDHPDVSFADATRLRDEAFEQAVSEFKKAGRNPSDELRDYRMNQIFNEKLPTIRKSKDAPAPVTSTPPKKTATAPSASAPAGKTVIPSSSGARKNPVQLSDVKKRLAAHFAKP